MCYSRGTVLGYMHEAVVFAEFAEHQHKLRPDSICLQDVEAWQLSLHDACSYKPSSIVTRMRRLRAFFAFLIEAGVINQDPCLRLQLPRLTTPIPRGVLTVAEIMRLLKSPDSDTVIGRRDRLIIEVLYATGVRVSELCGLDIEDVDLAGRAIHIRNGKGAKDRVVPLGQTTTSHLKAHIASLYGPIRSIETEHPLFVSWMGRRLSPCSVQILLRREATACGINKRVTPHVLRHSCATHMYSRGASILHVKQMLGHADVTTTQIYTRVAPREAMRTHSAKHPRERYFRKLERMGQSLPKVTIPPVTVDQVNRPNVNTRPVFCETRRPVIPAYGLIPLDGTLPDMMHDWLTEYRKHLQLLNRNDHTISAHIARLLSFFKFVMGCGITDGLKIDRNVIRAYRDHLAEIVHKRKATTGVAVQNQYLAVVLCLFRFLTQRGILLDNPTVGIRYAREPSPLPRGIPSPEFMRQFLDQPDLATPLGLRDRAILEVLYSCGLRKSELIALTIDSIDLDDGRVSVWSGKGSKDRVVPIGKMASAFVQQYLIQARARLVTPRSPADTLFLSMRGGRLSKNTILCLVEKYAKAVGMAASGITPHSIRHAFATHLIQNGAKLKHVQEMLGHTKLSSTQVYVHLTISDLKKAHRKAHPLG